MADPVHGLNLSGDDNSKKSRKGSIPRNVETYLKTAAMNAFADEMAKLANGEQPAKEGPSKLRRLKHMAQGALLTGTAAPIVSGGREFVKGFVDGGGNFRTRVSRGATKATEKLTAGEIAGRAVAGGLGGGLLGYAKDQLARHQAKEAGALVGGAPSGPRIAVAAGPSSSAKGMRVGNTPIAAKSGVTRTAAAKPVNPRMSLSDAMAPKV